MMMSSGSVVAQRRPSTKRDEITRSPCLLGLGTAVPNLCRSQQDVQATMARLWGLNGGSLERWRRIIQGSGIEVRYGVMPPEDVVHLTTAQRMTVYERCAPELAVEAATRAIDASAVAPRDITDVIVVSCTGFSAPGVDVALVERLGLDPTVRRMLIGFMGCFGAITGLRAAIGACAANPEAVALVVCVELCSLHMRADPDPQNQVASALFSDGAAAAVVASLQRSERAKAHSSQVIGRLTTGGSMLISEGHDWMSWRISDAGFAMTLSREVPTALRECLQDFVSRVCPMRPEFFAVHPGGPGILDAADEALSLSGGCGLEAARSVLRGYGNMSSATVLFVLEETARLQYAPPGLLLAFGPGLTVEGLSIMPVNSPGARC